MKSIIIFIVLVLGMCIIISPAAWGEDSNNVQSADDFFQKGNEFFAQGKMQEAIDAYDEAIEKDLQHAGALSNKAAALNQMGRFEEAISICEKAL